MDTLFLTAATGEPRFQAQRDSCEKALLGRGAATVEYLLAERLSDQTPRQRRYVETLFGLLSDSGRVRFPGEAIAGAMAAVPDQVRPQLLYIASTMGDTSLGKLGLEWLTHDSLAVRCMAARLLGAYPKPAYAELLLRGLGSAPEVERHQRLWSLSAVYGSKDGAAPTEGGKSCGRLQPYLVDSSLAVRHMAIRALANCAGGDFERIGFPDPEKEKGNSPRGISWLTWMELARVIAKPEALAWSQKAASRLAPESRSFFFP